MAAATDEVPKQLSRPFPRPEGLSAAAHIRALSGQRTFRTPTALAKATGYPIAYVLKLTAKPTWKIHRARSEQRLRARTKVSRRTRKAA